MSRTGLGRPIRHDGQVHRRPRSELLLMGLLVGLLAACAGPSPTVPSASVQAPTPSLSLSPAAPGAAQRLPPEIAQRWLAFSRGQEAVSSDVYVSRADGSELRQLTHGPGFRYNPAWSPDGSTILYRVEGKEGAPVELQRGGTWIIDADGANDHSITAITGLAGGGVSQPWAADGSRLLIAAATSGHPPQIWSVKPDGSDARALTPEGTEAQYPAWSPDGKKIAFAMVKGPDFRIYLINADGSDIVQITAGPHDNWPSWSPDGSKIAFGRGGGIALMNADGSNVETVIPEEVAGVPAAWAPGTLLVFNCSVEDGVIGICARDADGTVMTLLGGLDAGFPSWKP